MTPAANKELVRHVFEDVIPAGDAAALRTSSSMTSSITTRCPDSRRGADGATYVVRTMHGAHPDLRFTIDDLVAEGDRVVISWTLRGTNTGPLLGRPPTGESVELAAMVIFRIEEGLIAERWAAWRSRRPADG